MLQGAVSLDTLVEVEKVWYQGQSAEDFPQSPKLGAGEPPSSASLHLFNRDNNNGELSAPTFHIAHTDAGEIYKCDSTASREYGGKYSSSRTQQQTVILMEFVEIAQQQRLHVAPFNTRAADQPES